MGTGTGARALFGVLVAYHITSTWRETHRGQTDLQQVGWLYSLLFLPAANVISYGMLLAFAAGGGHQVGVYLSRLWEVTMKLLPL